MTNPSRLLWQQMQYDLGDSTIWEYMFPSNEKPILHIPEEETTTFDDDEEVRIQNNLSLHSLTIELRCIHHNQ